MMVEKITTRNAPEPGGWYSQAYKVGDIIYTAGVTAHDPNTRELIAPGDIAGQTRQVLENLEQILMAAGSDLTQVVKTLVFVADINHFDLFNETYKEFFPVNPPARSTMEVGKFKDGMVIEIEAVATVIR